MVSEEETIYHIDFENDDREVYVLAPSEKAVHVTLKRMYRAPMYDFEWEEYELTDTGTIDVESMVRGDYPYNCLEARRYMIIGYEKRVNQAGYKGVYTKRWHR